MLSVAFLGGSGAGADGTSLLVGASKITVKGGVFRSQRTAAAHFGLPSPPETYMPETNVTMSGTFGTAEPPRLVEHAAVGGVGGGRRRRRERAVVIGGAHEQQLAAA